MGGCNSHMQTKNKATPASSSVFGFLKHRRQRWQDDRGGWGDPSSPKKVRKSDYDRGHYVGDPRIDGKASCYIAKFHEACVSESECCVINAAYDHGREENRPCN